jgi:hypothetical protein
VSVMRCSKCGTDCQDEPCVDGNPDSHTPVAVHTCHGNEHMPPGPCSACEEDKAAYEAECGKAIAEQAEEAQERYDWERATEGQ